LVGLPNAGKSTLMNALIGQKLSIVTAKAQTTRATVSGIRSEDGVQAVFADTPGLVDPRNLLHKAMRGLAYSTFAEADLRLIVIDASRAPDAEPVSRLAAVLGEGPPRPTLIVLNHMDRSNSGLLDRWRVWAALLPEAEIAETDASRDIGVEQVWRWVAERLPEHPFLYDPEDLSTENLRFFVSELVRETAFEQYRQEIPYAIVCTVDEFREAEDPVYIGITVHVERESQKGMVVGRGGAAIRALGSDSRAKIETLLERPVYLDLWVKVLPGWRSRPATLKRLGFDVPDEPNDGARG